MKIAREIDLLIRARYPLIAILSSEDERVVKTIKNVSGDSRNLYSWRFGEGFESLFSSGPCPDLSVHDPLMALEEIERFQGHSSIFILKDFHLFWRDNRLLVKLRSLASLLGKTTKNIIIITPSLNMPLELKDDVTILNFPLPDYEDMEEILQEVINKLPSDVFLDSSVKERVVKSALGLSGNQAGRVFFKCITKKGVLDERSIEQILYEKKQLIGENTALRYFSVSENIGSVGGLTELKSWLKKREKSFSREARNYGLPTPKGLLLVGIPGTGKSLVAKAISGLWKMPLLRLDVGAIFGGLVGQSEENIRTAINLAETISPSILWIDEIEKGLFGQQRNFTDSGVTARVSATILTWMQEKTKPVFVVATANDIKGFSLEELRMGRFDSIFFLDLPTEEERKDIFRVHLEKRRPVIRHYDINRLASISQGYTGAEIEQIIIEAMHNAFNDGARDFRTEDIEESFSNIIPSSEMMRESIDELRTWVQDNRIRSASKVETKKNIIFERSSYIKVEPFRQ